MIFTDKVNNAKSNQLFETDKPFHEWYRFVLSYPAHLVKHYIQDFKLTKDDEILDPFCGTGTTLVESKMNGIPSIGIEANPFAFFASNTKVNWNVDIAELMTASQKIKENAISALNQLGMSDDVLPSNLQLELQHKLSDEQEKLILNNSISPVVFQKVMVLKNAIDEYKNQELHNYLILALGHTVVYEVSNLKFGPEVGLGKRKLDSNVISIWFNKIQTMINDLNSVIDKPAPIAQVYLNDARRASTILHNHRISAVITSPPYPNEKDYSRTTRLESVLLNFINTKEELRNTKKSLLRSNTRGVYSGDNDDEYVKHILSIQDLAKQIEEKRIELKKDSGFEKLYHKVVRLYFGGMAKHLDELKPFLRPGAQLAYVVGDQASYFQILIKTSDVLRQIAENLGYEYVRTDLFRTRFSTKTKQWLNEDVLILKWNG